MTSVAFLLTQFHRNIITEPLERNYLFSNESNNGERAKSNELLANLTSFSRAFIGFTFYATEQVVNINGVQNDRRLQNELF